VRFYHIIFYYFHIIYIYSASKLQVCVIKLLCSTSVFNL